MSTKRPPFDPDKIYQRAIALHQTGKLKEAESLYKTLLSYFPNQVEVLTNLSVLLLTMGRHNEGETLAKQSLSMQTRQPALHYNLGVSFQNNARLGEALASYDKALALNPGDIQSHLNRGITLKDLRHPEEASKSFDRAIQLKPDFAAAYWNKAILMLLMGRYQEGWQLYEWGWRCGERGAPRGFSQPLWLGKDNITGKSLLIHGEQGLGDILQFCRYAPLVAALGAKVILEVPASLAGLMQTIQADIQIAIKGEPLPPFDAYCPVMSLPLAFGTTIDTVPATVPYLAATPEKRAEWQLRLGPRQSTRIGLVWSGSTGNKIDLNPYASRHLPLASLKPLLELPFEFHSLQKEIREDDRATMAEMPSLHAHQENLHDFTDTAALVAEMDLVISVCTSVAHLAGAMGKDTWILLAPSADYRWMLDREDSPWYPTVKLMRQVAAGDHTGLIGRVRSKLSAL